MIDLEQMSDDDLLKLYEDKKKSASQLHNKQMSIKILLNSLYGACANPHFIYFKPTIASSITKTGQLSVMWAEKNINEYMNRALKTDGVDYVIYCDTDSVYVNFGPLVASIFGDNNPDMEQGESFLDKVCEVKISKVIAEGYTALAEMMNSYRQAMSMKREKINNRGLFIAKKRNILSTLNSEGVHYSTPKISVTGVEAVRSSTPAVCRKKMMEVYELVINKTEADLQDFVAEFRDEFVKLPPSEIGKVSGTNDIDAYMENGSYKKGCPIHIRGCIVYNNMIKSMKLEDKYDLIRSGDKIKFIYLKEPNIFGENIISFPDTLPREFNIDNYIDHDLQFDKVFLSPIQIVLDTIGWSWEKKTTLEGFFS
jgi:DNA polymerase elongation subunit (family B)